MRLVEIGCGGECFVLHGQQHLGQGCAACGGQQVADVGLDGADDTARIVPADVGPELFETGNLNRVADRGAGCVTFDQIDITRLPAGPLVGGAHCAQLSFRHGSQQTAADVVGQADPPDNTVNPVAMRHGVFSPLEQEQTGAFADYEAVARRVKRGTDAPF